MNNNGVGHKKIDWLITLMPLATVAALCMLFFTMPRQSNAVLNQNIGSRMKKGKKWKETIVWAERIEPILLKA